MADAEIDVVRAQLAAHPRPTDLSEWRKRLSGGLRQRKGVPSG